MLYKQPVDLSITNQLDKIIAATKRLWIKNYDTIPTSKDLFLASSIPVVEETKDRNNLFIGLLNEQQKNILANAFGFGACTNAMFYAPNSCMGWHTNSDTPGIRTYYTYTEGEAIFRYKDPITGDICNDFDNVGWTCRSFTIDPNRPLWHTVWSEKLRFAFGFNNDFKPN